LFYGCEELPLNIVPIEERFKSIKVNALTQPGKPGGREDLYSLPSVAVKQGLTALE